MTAPLALYVHWPFCVSKCPYCDFNSHVRAQVDMAVWHSALLSDLAHEAALLPGRTLGSIFFGGGTPSLMPPDLVADIIAAASRYWTVADDIEITLEANPSSVEAARFADLAAAGVNRVSLGIQSLDDNALAFLGRAHSSDEAMAAIATAQRHFGRVSLDFIYSLPDQNLADWQAMLERALGFGTEHLSLYQLTIEPGTRFASDVRLDRWTPADDDLQADMFALTQSQTAAADLPAYEISNHARTGAESRHNLTYWRYEDYAGIGPGAHGRRLKMATQRHKKPENFLNAVSRNGHGLQEETPLADQDRAMEALLMGLRLREGVDLTSLRQKTGLSETDMIDEVAAKRLDSAGLIAWRQGHIALTDAGRPLLDAILAEIVAVEASVPA